ncbi:MAG: DeoR/GlpR family DNA-binding transcription regulator [Pseudomonadota bacterium]
MLRTARQATIMKALGMRGACSVSDLARELAVSDETIRRDVIAMADKGLVERVHGGITLPQLLREPAFRKRMAQNAAAKRVIAAAAADEIRNGESIVMDTGSTTAYVAQALSDHRDLLVVTNCTEIATRLAARNRVYLAGGELRADDGAVFGPSATRFLEQFRVSLAILSIGAIDGCHGLMDYYLEEAEFSQAAIGRAERVMVVADHTKFGNQAPVQVCDFAAVDVIVTDQAPEAAIARRLKAAKTAVKVA